MKLIIPAAIERRLNAYVQGLDAEIAGMGSVEMREDGNLWVTDIAIYDQEVTGGTADLSSEALAHFQTDLVKRGISPKNWYLWWHSHVNMAAYFSTIDTGTIDSSSEFDHMVSLVVNKRRERQCRIDTHRPFRLVLDKVPVEIAPEVNAQTMAIDEKIYDHMEAIKELQEEKKGIETAEPEGIAEEIAAKVKRKYYAPAKAPVGFRRQGGGQQQGDRGYLQLPLDDKWAKKRKKDGTVSTPGEIIAESALDIDEVDLLIENTTTMIRAHEANGNGDTVECDELREDLRDYQDYKLQLILDEAEDEYVLDQHSGTYVPRSDIQWDDDDDNMGLPALPKGYKYGFNRGRDDDRY